MVRTGLHAPSFIQQWLHVGIRSGHQDKAAVTGRHRRQGTRKPVQIRNLQISPTGGGRQRQLGPAGPQKAVPVKWAHPPPAETQAPESPGEPDRLHCMILTQPLTRRRRRGPDCGLAILVGEDLGRLARPGGAPELRLALARRHLKRVPARPEETRTENSYPKREKKRHAACYPANNNRTSPANEHRTQVRSLA